MDINNKIDNIIEVNTDKCIGCNKCVKVCPIKFANTTKLKEGTKDKFVTEVNSEKCIQCGECIKVCKHGARKYTDHSEKFFEMFENGEAMNIIVAPSIKTAFPDNMWKHLLQWFRENGNVKIYDVSFGADICSWAYNDYLKHNKGSKIISQPCPAIVNYIEKYEPKLIMKLAPVHSPAACLAIYLKKYHHLENDRPIVLFSPCIAKTSEAIKYNTFNFNVTFDNIKKYFTNMGISFENLGTSNFTFNGDEGILGRLYPRPSGLKDNLLALNGDILIRSFEGPQSVYKRLNDYVNIPETRRPDILDVLNCQYGCSQGTGFTTNYTITEIESFMNEIEMNAQKDRGRFLNKDKNYKRFDKNLDIKDFRCVYKNQYTLVKLPTEEEINNIFNSMCKISHEDRTIDCGSCGYESCHEMASMIYQGYNTKNNCVFYMKALLHKQLTEVNDLHNTLEHEVQILMDTSESLNSSIDSINKSSERSNNTLKGLISDLNSMSAVVQNFHEYFSEVNISDISSDDVQNVVNLLEKLADIFNDSFLSRLQDNINNDNETLQAIKNLDEQSQKLLNMISEISNYFEIKK